MADSNEGDASGDDDAAERRGSRPVAGVVLAGGRSTRFEGGDKALATVDGEPMLARVVDALATVTRVVVVNCRADQRDAFAAALDDTGVDVGVRFALDERPDEGPVAGLASALACVDAPVVVVAACDLPWLDPALVQWLAGALEGGDAASPESAAEDAVDAVVPVVGGYPKPTCAAYGTDALAAAVDETLAAGSRRFRDVLDALAIREVDVRESGFSTRSLADVDSRADLER
ncbi:molybdenum cofactor guanylyltransferase [Halorubellus salinus]|uniref:molybdenum cofactor guanylyltransferase n=1 Tax=Halorubellus salinus TaxID=755309 RepID=UPI001D090612|nr:molybdenum cofactor guanylyltransferase [Halorubellus salinus]